MTAVSIPASNPFPAEAFATYGTAGITCVSLKYMLSVQRELNQYLTAYSLDKDRYGAAIGLRGGHGSGKTHVLAWLAESMHGAKSIRGTATYGKCDTSKFFDLCYQLMTQLDRPLLIELIQLALLNLARAKVRLAKITESLAERLQTVGGLQLLQEEKNIDLEQLRQQLLGEIETSTGAKEISRVLLDVPDAMVGASAHRWLTGNDIEDVARLGVTHQLRTLPSDGTVDGAVEAESSAISALETIAALHRMAGVPLLVLVDQLEVLLRTPDPATFQTSGSFIKKFVEQLARQSAMIFVAGLPEAWDKLLRDVSARFRQRDQIVVGSLSLAETRLLLDAYTQERSELPAFKESAIVAVRKLSGGSPREILRIAHHTFNKTNGNLALANEGVLLESARSSGSISDRAKLALATVDTVLPMYGTLSRDLAVEGHIVDRVLLGDAGQVIMALVVVKATDPLDEIDSARRVQDVQRYREDHWKQAELLVVTVGYSSAEVHSILGETSLPIAFNEKTFEGELRTRLVAITNKPKAPGAVPAPTTTPTDSHLAQTLSEISARLRELEQRRSEESARIQERFAHHADKLAAPLIAENQLTTRREVLDALYLLEEALRDGGSGQERKLVRSILVANEAYLHNSTLDDLGELYLETIALEQLNYEDPDMRSSRHNLIQSMRDSLRRPSGFRSWLDEPRRFAILLLGLFGAFLATGLVSAYRQGKELVSVPQWLFLPYPNDFISALPFLFFALAAVLLYAYTSVWFFERMRRARYQKRLIDLRLKVQERATKVPTIRRNYPQA